MFDVEITSEVTVSVLMVNVLKRMLSFLHKSTKEPPSDHLDLNNKWLQVFKSEKIQHALKDDSDWHRLYNNPNDDMNKVSADNDDQSNIDLLDSDDQSSRDKLYTIFRIMLQ